MSRLDQIDLNLLISLKYLLMHRHVSRAADALSLTQSGMSRNLARLRDLFNDDLLVRVGNQMLLTERAETLKNELDAALAGLEQLLQGEEFSPAVTPMHFRVAAPDFVVQLYFSLFCAPLLAAAPYLTLDWHGWSDKTMADLEQGKLDYVLGGNVEAPANIYQRSLGTVNYVCISRKQHPAIKDKLTLDIYCALGHVVTTVEGHGRNPIDELLAQQNRRRNIVIKTPHFMSAAAIAAQTDLLALVDARLAEAASTHHAIDVHKIPFQIGETSFSLRWHKRNHKNPAHRWFRDMIASQVTSGA